MNIKSTDYKNIAAKSFDILVDPNPADGQPVIALMVEPRRGDTFIIPMDLKAARDIAVMFLNTLGQVSPQMFVELFN